VSSKRPLEDKSAHELGELASQVIRQALEEAMPVTFMESTLACIVQEIRIRKFPEEVRGCMIQW